MGSDFGIASLKMIGSLLIVLGLIVGLFYLLKRLRPRALHAGRYPQMRLLGTLNLAPKRAVALVELCGEWLVVGVGTESVHLITKMERPPDADQGEAAASGNGKSFQSILQNSSALWQQWSKGMVKRTHEDS